MKRDTTGVLVVCITVIVCVVVATVGLVYVFAPDNTDTPGLAAILVGVLAPTIASMVAVIKVGSVGAQVADVAEDTNKLANGLGDAKMRAAVGDVLHPDLIDPAAKEQLERDRLRTITPEDHA